MRLPLNSLRPGPEARLMMIPVLSFSVYCRVKPWSPGLGSKPGICSIRGYRGFLDGGLNWCDFQSDIHRDRPGKKLTPCQFSLLCGWGMMLWIRNFLNL